MKRDKAGLSEILYALGMGEKADRKSPIENVYERKPKTVKRNIVDKIEGVSEVDPGLKFTTSDFEEETDSAIMVRERTRASKLKVQFRKKSGKTFEETAQDITFLSKGGKKEVVYSKRVVAKTKPQKKSVKPRREDQAGPSTRWEEMEESSEDETYIVSEETKDDESTPTDTTITANVEKKDGTDNEEGSRPDAVETESKEKTIPTEENIPGK